MKASLSALSRIRIPRSQIALTALLIVVGFGAEFLILVNYLQLTQRIDASLVPASNLLPQLSALRSDVLLTRADTETELNSDLADYDLLAARRASVVDRLASIRAIAPDTEEYASALASVDTLLIVFDSQLAIYRGKPTPVQVAALRFEIQRAFQGAEDALGALYQKEEQDFYTATSSTLSTVRGTQTILFTVGILIIGLGAVLVTNIRRAARRETVLASGRLQVAAEVGQAASSFLGLDQLFDTTLNLICERFGYFYAAVFLTDDKGEYAALRAATGEAGRGLLAKGHKVLVGSNSTIGSVTFNNRPRVFHESRRTTEYFKNELLPSTRSELAIPLRQGGQVIGALDVQSLEDDAFSQDEITILQTLADQIAVAIGNAAEFTREQVRARQMSALSQAAMELTGPQISLEYLLEAVARRATPLLGAEDAGIWLPTEEGEIQLKANVSQPESVGRRLKMNEGVPGQVFITGKPLRIDDYGRWEGRSRASASESIQTAMGVPLLWQGETVGVLTATRSQSGRPFSTEDERIAQLFASQAAAAIENARLLQETQDRVNELYTLNQIGQAIAAQTDLRALFDVVRQEATRAVNTRNFYIALYDDETNQIELPYIYENGEITSVPPFPLGPGLTSAVINGRQPLLVRTKEEAAARGALVTGSPSESYLGVPVIMRDRVLGAIAVQDIEKQYLFSDADARLLLTIASQVGLAIQNIRLLEQTRRRAEELSALNRLTVAATSVADLQATLEGIVREVVHIFGAHSAGIALLDPTRSHLTIIADYSAHLDLPSARGSLIPLAGNPSSAQVVETGRSIIISDAQTSPLTESVHERMRQRRIACVMIIPLIARGEVIGAISIDTDLSDRVFTHAEMALAETIAGQISSAVDNSRLFQQVRHRADQLAAAAEVGRAATSLLDPDELIVRAADLIHERFSLYYVAIFIVDEKSQWAVLRYATGEAGKTLMERKHRLEIGGKSMVGTAVMSRQARVALDVGQEAVRFANPLLPDTHSEMALPLVVGGQVLGALDVQSTEYSAFAEADITVLQTVADQIAVAIQNARLYHEARSRARLEQLINRVTSKLRRTIDADSIMAATLSELQDALGARRVAARLGPEQQLRAAQHSDEGDGRDRGNGRP